MDPPIYTTCAQRKRGEHGRLDREKHPRGSAQPPSKKMILPSIILPHFPLRFDSVKYPIPPFRLPLCFNSSGHWKLEKIIRNGDLFYVHKIVS
jgi:hypothetical protein